MLFRSHFDGKFIGVLPKRRSAISPENSADARPYKTPIWAPFFVVKEIEKFDMEKYQEKHGITNKRKNNLKNDT